MCPQGGSHWLGLSELCHPKLHWGEGARIGGKLAMSSERQDKSQKRWPHLTAPKEQSSHQSSARSPQFGTGLCNHGLTVYMGDMQSTFTFINSFNPHNSGEESRAGCSRLLLPREKNKLGLQGTVAQPERAVHLFDPLSQFLLSCANLPPASK